MSFCKLKCSWCDYPYVVQSRGMKCTTAICPIYKENFRVVYEAVECLACSKPCKEKKVCVEDVSTE
jgi:hypothetical protein